MDSVDPKQTLTPPPKPTDYYLQSHKCLKSNNSRDDNDTQVWLIRGQDGKQVEDVEVITAGDRRGTQSESRDWFYPPSMASSDRPGVGGRTRRTWRLNSDATGRSSVPGNFAGRSPIQAAAAPSNQSCSLDKTVLFLILLIFPKLLLPQMTWQVFPHDVIKRSLKGNVVESQHPIIFVSGSFAAALGRYMIYRFKS